MKMLGLVKTPLLLPLFLGEGGSKMNFKRRVLQLPKSGHKCICQNLLWQGLWVQLRPLIKILESESESAGGQLINSRWSTSWSRTWRSWTSWGRGFLSPRCTTTTKSAGWRWFVIQNNRYWSNEDFYWTDQCSVYPCHSLADSLAPV